MNEVDQEGEKMLIHPEAPRNQVWLFDDYRDKPEDANEFATYRVRMTNGLGVEGLVFPHVVSFDGKKKPYKLFVSQKNSTLQANIAGVKVIDSSELQKILVPGVARVGQTGTFVFIEDGKAIATEPVTIKTVEEYGPMTAITLMGEKIRISRGYASCKEPSLSQPVSSTGKAQDKENKIHYLDLHAMVKTAPNEYVIPRHMLWIPMEGFRDLATTPDEWLQKDAAARAYNHTPTTVRYSGIVFELDGNGLERTECDERMAKMALAAQGAALPDIERIIKVAKQKGRVQAFGLSPLRKKADIIKEANDAYDRVEKLCTAIRPADLSLMLKVAAEIEDKATVDAILSLNFINPDNVAKFVAYRPVFEKVCDALAELAMASRLGMTDVQEAACVIGMGKLRDVINGLKRIEAGMLKGPANKIAAASTEKGENKEHFANGMMDGEVGSPLHLDRARLCGAEAMLAYMRGKRIAEMNKAQAKQITQMGMPQAQPGSQPGAQAGAKAGAQKATQRVAASARK